MYVCMYVGVHRRKRGGRGILVLVIVDKIITIYPYISFNFFLFFKFFFLKHLFWNQGKFLYLYLYCYIYIYIYINYIEGERCPAQVLGLGGNGGVSVSSDG